MSSSTEDLRENNRRVKFAGKRVCCRFFFLSCYFYTKSVCKFVFFYICRFKRKKSRHSNKFPRLLARKAMTKMTITMQELVPSRVTLLAATTRVLIKFILLANRKRYDIVFVKNTLRAPYLAHATNCNSKTFENFLGLKMGFLDRGKYQFFALVSTLSPQEI